MELALSLAEKGRGLTRPNPMVGAVIVRGDEIAGQGFHRRAGGDHAEIVALAMAGERARGATLYVTLEPCSHYGKTPPCCEAVARSGISRVVAAMTDPNPLVSGRGFVYLREHGVAVESGLLEDRAALLNEVYLKFIRTGRPFVTLKLAVTLDGRIAARDGSAKWISGPESRKRVHRMRALSDAVMVGAGTVLADNPRLTVRDVEGQQPVRVVLDSRLRIPEDALVYDGGAVIVITSDSADEAKAGALRRRGAEVIAMRSSGGFFDLAEVLDMLGGRGMSAVLCEGGSTLATGLLRSGLADKVAFFVAPKLIGAGIGAVGDLGIDTMERALELKNSTMEIVGGDALVTGYPRYKGTIPHPTRS
jgi:diaminohydroxyphosphoribosylaminopyrimidine deaminase / 5-amino-6-(5-phosphoribosylamino)uracil reductase